jgi:hypothetical protein
LKACGVVTGAAAKRNPVCAPNAACAGRLCPDVRSNPGQQSVAAVLPLQLIDQVLERGGQFGRFGTNVLLQPFTDATTNRSAGSAIDLFTALVDSVGHREFRPAFVAIDWHETNSSRPELFRSLIDCMSFA